MEITGNLGFSQLRDGSTFEHARRWGLAASLALHVGVGIGIVLFPTTLPRHALAPPSVTVRLLTSEEFEATARPIAVPPAQKPSGLVAPQHTRPQASAPDEARPSRPDVRPQPGAFVRATELFSTSVLAEEGSRQVRETLPLLAKADRVMQLCNIEAVEQIRRTETELQPDYVVADAIKDAELRNISVNADGGAFRSRGSWYRLEYHCTATPNLRGVASFEFHVGETIPKRDWKKLHLTSEGQSQD